MSTRLDIELQALITERDGMNAENETREHGSNAPAYGMDHYQELASRMRDLIERYADNGPVASSPDQPGPRPTREEVSKALGIIQVWNFIPEGWTVPLGFDVLVNQAKDAVAVLRRAVEPRPAPLPAEVEEALVTIEHSLAAYERRFGEDDADTRAAIEVLRRAVEPRKVSREWFDKLCKAIAYQDGTNESMGIIQPVAKAMLAELGVEVG